jgi:hypothetical protein
LRDLLVPFDIGGEIEAFFGQPAIAGKYYLRRGLQEFQFRAPAHAI